MGFKARKSAGKEKIDESDAVLGGLLAKQGAAGAALTNNAQSAIRTLANMQDEMVQRTEALKSVGVTDRPTAGSKDLHCKEFFDITHHEKGNKQGLKRKFENNERGDHQGG